MPFAVPSARASPPRSAISTLVAPVVTVIGTAGAVVDKAGRLGRHAMSEFGIAFVLLVWVFVWQMVRAEQTAFERETCEDVVNIAPILEQNVRRTIEQLDHTLMFLRKSFELGGYKMNWRAAVQANFVADDQVVQVGVIDRNGIVVTSSAMLDPKVPIDLHDREHFRVHAQRPEADTSFISKPVKGRITAHDTIKLSRPFWTADHAFDGVLVISLDTDHLTHILKDLHLGSIYGLAVVGNDDVIRSGSGIYAARLGETMRPLDGAAGEPAVRAELRSDHALISTARSIAGYPLRVVVTADRSDAVDTMRQRHIVY